MRTRLLDAQDWSTWRDIRLRALAESPSAFGSTYHRELAFTEDIWRSRLEDPDQVAVLAIDGSAPAGLPVGMAAGYPDEPGLLHVVAMWVDPKARGQRVAHLLLTALDEWAATHHRGLHLDVNITNRAARRSYERFGFVGTGETRPLREGSPESVERMVLPARRLTGTPGSR